MGINDVIKKSVLEGFSSGNVGVFSIFITLGLAVVFGLYIFFIYRITAKSGFFSRNFNMSLAVLPVITAGILVTMQNSLVISLGMVGALSIVRFRNAVKDTADLTFLFWSISIGIILGAREYTTAVILSLLITILVLGLDRLPRLREPYLLVVMGNHSLEEKTILTAAAPLCKRCIIRSHSISQKGTEFIVELQVRDANKLVDSVAQLDGVSSVNLMSHDGEVRF